MCFRESATIYFMQAMIEVGKKEASLLYGGSVPEESELQRGCYVLPTIFENVPIKMHALRKKKFSVLLSVCLK